jgi:4'-phosphopantetheinyl transferase
MALLSNDEKDRLARYHFESDRNLFAVAHALVRLGLSRHSQVDPGDWQFRLGSYGRPEIAAPGSQLRFSLSHTRGLAVCAVTLNWDIGVDVEETSQGSPIEIADRYFSSREVCDLREIPACRRRRRFFEYWTLKESYSKARGMGLSLPPDRFWFRRDSKQVWRIEFGAEVDDDPTRWHFWSWQIGVLHQLALALGKNLPNTNIEAG